MSLADSANSDDFKVPARGGKPGGGINWTISARDRVHHIALHLAEPEVTGLAAAALAGVPVGFVEGLLPELSLSQRGPVRCWASIAPRSVAAIARRRRWKPAKANASST